MTKRASVAVLENFTAAVMARRTENYTAAWRVAPPMKGETILCLAAASWTGMWARAQQFMTIFARQGNRVLTWTRQLPTSPFKKPFPAGTGC